MSSSLLQRGNKTRRTVNMGRETFTPYVLFETENPDSYVWDIRLSHDGRKIVMGVELEDEENKYYTEMIVVDKDRKTSWIKDLGVPIRSVSWFPNTEKLVVGTGWTDKEVKTHGKIIIFNSNGNKLWESQDLGKYVHSISWSPDGKKLTIGTGKISREGKYHGNVIVFNTGRNILWKSKDLRGLINTISWSPDGQKIGVLRILGDIGEVTVISKDGNKLWETECLDKWIFSIAWSPDGKRLALGGDSNKVIVFDSNGNELWESKDLGGWVRCVSWSPDGEMLAVGGDFNKVIVFDSNVKNYGKLKIYLAGFAPLHGLLMETYWP